MCRAWHGMNEAWNQSMKARTLDGDVFLPKFHPQDSREWRDDTGPKICATIHALSCLCFFFVKKKKKIKRRAMLSIQ